EPAQWKPGGQAGSASAQRKSPFSTLGEKQPAVRAAIRRLRNAIEAMLLRGGDGQVVEGDGRLPVVEGEELVARARQGLRVVVGEERGRHVVDEPVDLLALADDLPVVDAPGLDL